MKYFKASLLSLCLVGFWTPFAIAQDEADNVVIYEQSVEMDREGNFRIAKQESTGTKGQKIIFRSELYLVGDWGKKHEVASVESQTPEELKDLVNETFTALAREKE